MVIAGSGKLLSTSPCVVGGGGIGMDPARQGERLGVVDLGRIRLGWAKQTVAAAPINAETKMEGSFIFRDFSQTRRWVSTATNIRLDGLIELNGYNNSG
jgi:hypothetical protein